MSFTLSSPFPTPYYEGGGTTSITPFIAEVALGGHAYMLDWSAETPLAHVSIPVLRQQQDTSESPGEQSINNEGLWRRFGESWHMGAGQERFDRKESNEFRFNRSQGVDVWDKWQLRPLRRVEQKIANLAGDNQRLAVAGDRLYYGAADELYYLPDLASAPVLVTGTPAESIESMASNGFRVWTAHGLDGVYLTDRDSGSALQHISGTVNIIAYVKNRVLAAAGPNLYDVTSSAVGAASALPAPLFTHGNTDWNWVGFAESQSFIYAAGYSGDKSLIYSIGITTDGTVLDQPVVAGPLPDGEIVSAVYGYLGRFLALGTNKGFRLAVVSEGGGLTIGALIETPAPVLCFEGQEEFIWFGWTDFEAITSTTASGLGRMSTGSFSDLDKLVPAYASDLMATGVTGAVTSIVTFENRRIFAMNGRGVYAESADEYVGTCAIDTGAIAYGMTEPKTALYVDVKTGQNSTTNSPVSVAMSVDGGAFVTLGTFLANNMQTFNVGEAVGSEFELRFTFGGDDTDTTLAISLLSWLFRVQPRPLVTNLIYATILLAPEVTALNGTTLYYDTLSELDFIEDKNLNKEVITFQRNSRRYSVIVEDYEMNVKRLVEATDGMTGDNSSCLLKLKRV